MTEDPENADCNTGDSPADAAIARCCSAPEGKTFRGQTTMSACRSLHRAIIAVTLTILSSSNLTGQDQLLYMGSAPAWLQPVSTSARVVMTPAEETADQTSEWDFRPLDLDLSAGNAEDRSCGSEVCPPPLQKFRNGMLQGVTVVGGYLHDDGPESIAMSSMDLSATLAFPMGSFDNLLMVTPFFRADYLTASPALDLPAELYETGARFFWKKKIDERFGILGIVTPAVRTDFNNSEDALRIFGLGLLTWQMRPGTLMVSGGLIHTGRDDFPILPAAGLLWTPDNNWKFDLQFPSPRISCRLSRDGDCSETWGYLSGVFGGNTWSVQTASRGDTQLTLRDYRLMVGLEHVQTENRSIFTEFGLVFGRSIEFDDTAVPAELSNTWTIRGGICF